MSVVTKIIKTGIRVKNSLSQQPKPPIKYNNNSTHDVDNRTGDDGINFIDTDNRFLILPTRRNLIYASNEELNRALLNNLRDNVLNGVFLDGDEKAVEFIKENVKYNIEEVMEEIIFQAAVLKEVFIAKAMKENFLKPIILEVDDIEYKMDIDFDEYDDPKEFIHQFPVYELQVNKSENNVNVNRVKISDDYNIYPADKMFYIKWGTFRGKACGVTEFCLDPTFRKLAMDKQGLLIVYKNSNVVVVSPAKDNNGYPIFGNQDIPAEYEDLLYDMFKNPENSGTVILPAEIGAEMLSDGRLPSNFDDYYKKYTKSIYRTYNSPSALWEDDGGTYNLAVVQIDERDKPMKRRKQWLNKIMVDFFNVDLLKHGFEKGSVHLSWLEEKPREVEDEKVEAVEKPVEEQAKDKEENPTKTKEPINESSKKEDE